MSPSLFWGPNQVGGTRALGRCRAYCTSSVAWPTAIRDRLLPVHLGIAAKVVLLDAKVREAAGNVRKEAQYIIAHCTCVQALLMPGSKAAASRADNCRATIERAATWGVFLKPSVRRALDSASQS